MKFLACMEYQGSRSQMINTFHIFNYLNETNYLKETNYLNETNPKQTLNVNLNKTLTDIDNNPISPILPSNGSLKLSTLSISSSSIETFPETLKFDN